MNSSEKKRAIQIQEDRTFTCDDIPLITRVFQEVGLTQDTDWDYFSGTTMGLPDWFDFTLAPNSNRYKEQQLHLWRVISGRDSEYCPEVDEKAEMGFDDPNTIPGWFSRRSNDAITNAANHIGAIASILRNSGVKPGDRILEYGAGSGEISLIFSRLGVQVDTVDISHEFCRQVQIVSDFYKTNLSSFNMEFGFNPRGPAQKYSLILFYEAFHHALDFLEVAKNISSYLLPGGKIILAGEPIVDVPIPAIPYSWGMRLDVETVVVTRSRGWLELGFHKDYICSIFAENKLEKIIIKDFYSDLGNLYIFERVEDEKDFIFENLDILKGDSNLIYLEAWHDAEKNGRWTKENSLIAFKNKKISGVLAIEMSNPLPVEKNVSVFCGDELFKLEIRANQSGKLTIEINNPIDSIMINCNTHSPKEHCKNGSLDNRLLGIFIKKFSIKYYN